MSISRLFLASIPKLLPFHSTSIPSSPHPTNFHSQQEVAFVFNNIHGYGYELFPGYNPFNSTPPTYYALSKYMSNAWASFIATGDPNNNGMLGTYGIESWPVYDVSVNASSGPETGSGLFMQFDANDTVGIARAFVDDYRGAGIAFLNTLWESQFGK